MLSLRSNADDDDDFKSNFENELAALDDESDEILVSHHGETGK